MTIVTLVYPYFHPSNDNSIFRFPPLGLGYIAAYLKKKGISVELVDCTFMSFKDATERVKSSHPRIVGIQVMFSMKEKALQMAELLRKDCELLVAGRPLPTLRKGKEIANRLQLKCLFVSDFAGKENAEIEDLFAEAFYLKAVKEAYPNVTLRFTSEESEITGIAKRVEAAFNRMNISDFEKWRPLRLIADWIQKVPEVMIEDA